MLQEKLGERGLKLSAWAKIAWLAGEYNESGFLARCRNLKQIEIADFSD
jgi:hypothetical protein